MTQNGVSPLLVSLASFHKASGAKYQFESMQEEQPYIYTTYTNKFLSVHYSWYFFFFFLFRGAKVQWQCHNAGVSVTWLKSNSRPVAPWFMRIICPVCFLILVCKIQSKGEIKVPLHSCRVFLTAVNHLRGSSVVELAQFGMAVILERGVGGGVFKKLNVWESNTHTPTWGITSAPRRCR